MIHVIRTGIFSVNSLVVETGSKECFVVDPATSSISQDENKIVDYLKQKKLTCVGIILTHSHFDHVTGILPLKRAFPDAKIAIHEAEFQELQNPPGKLGAAVVNFFGLTDILSEVAKQPSAEVALKNGDDYFGWEVIHTPGHTPGSICLYKKAGKEGEEGLLISGDTIFDYGGYGRTDMAGGSEVQIWESIDMLKSKIPSGTLVYPGHDSFGFKF